MNATLEVAMLRCKSWPHQLPSGVRAGVAALRETIDFDALSYTIGEATVPKNVVMPR